MNKHRLLLLFRAVPFPGGRLANQLLFGAGQFGTVLIFGLELFWFIQAGARFGILSRGRKLRSLASIGIGAGVGIVVVRSGG